MPCKIAPLSRDTLLELAFSDIPSQVSGLTLRRLSAGSFTLLGRLGNPMIVGTKSPVEEAAAENSQITMFEGVIQYIWIHSADIEAVLAVETIDDIPVKEIRNLAFQISMGEAFAFLARYQDSALRASASLAEIDPEDDDSTPGKQESPRAGSPPSFTPAEPAEIPTGSATSSGSCRSNEHSPTSTPPTSETEPAADGLSLTLLPDLAGAATEEIPPN